MKNPLKRPYNYQPLDTLLTDLYDPQEIGNQLDEIMSDLVSHAGKEETYSQVLPVRHNLLKELRDLFWKLKQS